MQFSVAQAEHNRSRSAKQERAVSVVSELFSEMMFHEKDSRQNLVILKYFKKISIEINNIDHKVRLT